jgi:hypothetical protein
VTPKELVATGTVQTVLRTVEPGESDIRIGE